MELRVACRGSRRLPMTAHEESDARSGVGMDRQAASAELSYELAQPVRGVGSLDAGPEHGFEKPTRRARAALAREICPDREAHVGAGRDARDSSLDEALSQRVQYHQRVAPGF